MQIQRISRVVNIITNFNADTDTDTLLIYQPALQGDDILPGVNYYGFISDLKLVVDIDSVPEIQLPVSSLIETESEKSAKEKEAIINSQHKCISLYLKQGTLSPALIGEILLFNRYPYYYVNLRRYFTDTESFDVAPTTAILMQMKNVGYGLLQGTDKVTVVGNAIEEAFIQV